jgi:hypothetical protein
MPYSNEAKEEKKALAREKKEQDRLDRMLRMENAGLQTQQTQQQLRDTKRKSRDLTVPGRIANAASQKTVGLDRSAARVVGTGIRATGAAAGDLTRGVGVGVGQAFGSIFRPPSGGNMARSKGAQVSTRPIGLKSSGMELLGRDNKVYKLSPIAPPKGVRGAADYDALEATFGPTGGFTRDQALKVLVNVHSGQGQSLYAISGRFVFMVRQGYITEVPGVVIPQQTPADKQGILTIGSEYGILE